MKLYLTGSRALHHFFPEFSVKDDTDWDVVGDVESSRSVDVAPSDVNTEEVCLRYADAEISTPIGVATLVSPTGLMLLKRSHLHRPIEWVKHIRHYHFLKSRCVTDEKYDELLATRTRLTKEKYGDKTPKLNKTKAEFFDDYVIKKYEHDDIHYATCYGERPVYEELKTDNEKVWCSKEKWACVSHEKRIQCVQEEAFVISIERYLIPEPKFPVKFAFGKAVSRICTTLTSGWFRDFAIENWPEIIDCNYNFVERFENAGFRIS